MKFIGDGDHVAKVLELHRRHTIGALYREVEDRCCPASAELAASAGMKSAYRQRTHTALVLLCAAQFVVVLDLSIVNVALPSIQADLGATTEDLQWIVGAYALTFGGLLLAGGRAADRFGRRLMFMAGMVAFSFGSLLGGLAIGGGC